MSVFVKTYHFVEQFKEVNILKKRGRPSGTENKFSFRKPLSKNKFEDLKSMFPLIPKDCLAFYKNLTGSDKVQDDIEGINGQLDFELEDEDD